MLSKGNAKLLLIDCELKKTLSSSDEVPVLIIFMERKVRDEITSFIDCVRVSVLLHLGSY